MPGMNDTERREQQDQKVQLVTLREYLELQTRGLNDRLIAAEAAVNMKLMALEKAVAEKFAWTEQANKALSSQMDHRLESMNEFRESLRDQTAKFATASELKIANSSKAITYAMPAFFSRLRVFVAFMVLLLLRDEPAGLENLCASAREADLHVDNVR